jgi:hypothetical protein
LNSGLIALISPRPLSPPPPPVGEHAGVLRDAVHGHGRREHADQQLAHAALRAHDAHFQGARAAHSAGVRHRAAGAHLYQGNRAVGKLFVCTGRGLCPCRFRKGYIGPLTHNNFLRLKQDLLPAKAVLLPSQAGSTTAYPLRWLSQPFVGAPRHVHHRRAGSVRADRQPGRCAARSQRAPAPPVRVSPSPLHPTFVWAGLCRPCECAHGV